MIKVLSMNFILVVGYYNAPLEFTMHLLVVKFLMLITEEKFFTLFQELRIKFGLFLKQMFSVWSIVNTIR